MAIQTPWIVHVASPGVGTSNLSTRTPVPSRGRLWLPVDYRISTGLSDVTTAFLRNFSQSLEKACKRGLRA